MFDLFNVFDKFLP